MVLAIVQSLKKDMGKILTLAIHIYAQQYAWNRSNGTHNHTALLFDHLSPVQTVYIYCCPCDRKMTRTMSKQRFFSLGGLEGWKGNGCVAPACLALDKFDVTHN